MFAQSSDTIENRGTKRLSEDVAQTANLNEEMKQEVESRNRGFCIDLFIFYAVNSFSRLLHKPIRQMASEMFAQSTVTIENRGTKRRSTINWILQYISWEVLSYLLRLIVLCIRYKLNLTADLEGEEQQKELLQGEGFCVMCEKYYGDELDPNTV
ncbi:Hypothetical predicted protein [Cloeon dipterum]|uniref:Uncharacterized protein n=1 Tax=Cloeon dipterum TaxID=197152 RepID=A0A8S1DYA8_9INSE|nr:Hypothetical predicted protein [Cloeon dipterum]